MDRIAEDEQAAPDALPCCDFNREKWWAVRGSNPRPAVCKTDALPAELTALLRDLRKFTPEEHASYQKLRMFPAP